MTNFYKSLISGILSVSLISSSFTPAWAGLSTEDILRMKQAVSRALGELEKQEGPGIPPNANCDEIWNANAGALGADDEGMFKGFCVSWLDYVNREVCKNGIDGECQYVQQPKIVVAYYKAQRNTQEKNIEIALTNQANALSGLIYFLSEDEAATCKEVYRQCDETKNHSLTCNSVYGDIIPSLIGETGLDEEPGQALAKLLRPKVESIDKTCYNDKSWNDFEQERMKYVALLGFVGSSKEDANALGSYYTEKDSTDGGPTPDVIVATVSALMAKGHWTELKTMLNYSFNKKRSCPTEWGLGIGDLIRGIRFMSHPVHSEFACGWENSWFKEEGYENASNAWVQLGQIIGQDAAQGDQEAKKFLSEVSYKNPLFSMGVMVTGQHPRFNKSHPKETAWFVEQTALNLMVNLDPATKAYVRDGLYTIYTEIAGKSAEDAHKVALYDKTNLVLSMGGGVLQIAGGITDLSVYESYEGLYPAGSEGSNALIDAEGTVNFVWKGLEELGDWADWVMIMEASALAIFKIAKAFSSARKIFWTVFKGSRKAFGYGVRKATSLGVRAVGTVARLKAIGAWKGVSYSVSRIIYGSDSVKTMSRAMEVARAEYNTAVTLQGLEKGNNILKALRGKKLLPKGTTPEKLAHSVKTIVDPEVAAKLQTAVDYLKGLGLDSKVWKNMSIDDILKAVDEGKLSELQARNLKPVSPRGGKPRASSGEGGTPSINPGEGGTGEAQPGNLLPRKRVYAENIEMEAMYQEIIKKAKLPENWRPPKGKVSNRGYQVLYDIMYDPALAGRIPGGKDVEKFYQEVIKVLDSGADPGLVTQLEELFAELKQIASTNLKGAYLKMQPIQGRAWKIGKPIEWEVLVERPVTNTEIIGTLYRIEVKGVWNPQVNNWDEPVVLALKKGQVHGVTPSIRNRGKAITQLKEEVFGDAVYSVQVRLEQNELGHFPVGDYYRGVGAQRTLNATATRQLQALNESHWHLQAPKAIAHVNNSKHTAQFLNVTVRERWNEVLVFKADGTTTTMERFCRSVDDLLARPNPISGYAEADIAQIPTKQEVWTMIQDIKQVRNDMWKSYNEMLGTHPFGESEKFLNDKIGKFLEPAQQELERILVTL